LIEIEPDVWTQPHFHEVARTENRPRHTALPQALFDGALGARERSVVVELPRVRDEDEAFDAGIARGVDEVELSRLVRRLDAVTGLTRPRRRHRRHDDPRSAARRVE